MTTITDVRPNPKNAKQGFVRLDSGVEAWTPEFDKVESLIGKSIPEGWLLKDGEYGPQLLPPKTKGSGAWRNTKDGFEAEQAHMHRRTALMQAVKTADTNGPDSTLAIAEMYYRWLTGSGGGVDRGEGASPPEHHPAPDTRGGSDAGEAGGSMRGAPSPQPTHASWQPLWDLVDGDLNKARRAVTRANKLTSPVTDENEAFVTAEEIAKAVAMLGGVG